MHQIRNREDVEDFVRGCTFMGVGGGGAPEKGIEMLMGALESAGPIDWIDVDKIPDDVWTVCISSGGSIAPQTEETARRKKEFKLIDPVNYNTYVKTLETLQDFTGKEFTHIIPIEPGGHNTPIAMVTAVHLGISIVNGDYAGRAIPEGGIQTTPTLVGIPTWPRASVDNYGNIRIIKECCSLEMGERTGKMLSVASFGAVAEARFPLSGQMMKRVVVRDTLSKYHHIGCVIREARGKNQDPVLQVVDAVDGWILFRGSVVKKETIDKEGYYWGTSYIKGIGAFNKEAGKIFFKNENHIVWRGEEVVATSPDLIAVVDNATAEPITNTRLKKGMEIAVIGIRGHDAIRTERAIEVLGPNHFGFQIDYVPIERRVEFPSKRDDSDLAN